MMFAELFCIFFKIGLFTFGGGYAMLPLIQEVVIGHGWMEMSELIDFIAVSESTPGPFAINISTYIGAVRGGLPGAFFATLGVVVPSFVIILLVAGFLDRFKKNKIVSGCMSGLKPAVVGLIVAAVISVGKTVFFPNGISSAVFKSSEFYVSCGIFAVMTICAFKKLHPIVIICISAAIGIAFGFLN